MFFLYISHGIKMYYKKYSRLPNEEAIVRMWNGSIYNGYKKSSTERYYKKYKRIKRIIN